MTILGTVRDYTRAVNAFLTTGLENGANTDFTKRKLIGIGHSMGAAALYASYQAHIFPVRLIDVLL